MPGAPIHDGIEVTADGSFYFLHRDPTRGLARGTSNADTGTAQVAVGWLCQANMFIKTVAGASISSTANHYQSTPRQLWIYTSPEWGRPPAVHLRFPLTSGALGGRTSAATARDGHGRVSSPTTAPTAAPSPRPAAPRIGSPNKTPTPQLGSQFASGWAR